MNYNDMTDAELFKAVWVRCPSWQEDPALARVAYIALLKATDAPKKTKRTRANDPLPDLPATLDTPEMREAWTRWLAVRSAAKKPVRAPGAAQCFRDFHQWGIHGSIESINESIRNGYQGLFPPRGRMGQPAGVPVQHITRSDPRNRFPGMSPDDPLVKNRSAF